MTAVFDEFDLEEVHIMAPQQSKSGEHRSAHAAKPYSFQIGEQTEMKCTLVKKKGRGILLKLNTEDAAQFMHSFEAYCTDYLYDHCEEWFGRKLDRANVRRMLLSVINRDNEIVLRAAKNMRTYLLFDDDTVEEVEEVEGLRYVVPIIDFKGLYINNRCFSLSFSVTSLLVGEEVSETGEGFFDPKSMIPEKEDLENPYEGFDDWQEVSSHGSFRTEVWNNH